MGKNRFRNTLVLGCCLALLPTASVLAAPKKQAAKAALVLTVINQRTVPLTELIISDGQGAQIGGLTAPLEPGKRATVKLTRGSACEVLVTAGFADEGQSENTADACKDRTLRLTD
jgi:hypothetical protein